MVADGDDARKPRPVNNNFDGEGSVENQLRVTSARRLLSAGLAQVNLEIHQSVVFFEGHDVGDVQAGVA